MTDNSYTRLMRIALTAAAGVMLACLLCAARVYAADSGIPEGYVPTFSGADYPHVQMRDVFTDERIEVSGIRVIVEDDNYFNSEDDAIHFRIFNTTTQETEYEVDTVSDGEGNKYLPDMQLKKDHDYIFFVEDKYYRDARAGGPDEDNSSYPSSSKTYVQIRTGNDNVAGDGPGAYNYLGKAPYAKVTEITVERRDSACSDPFDDNRYDAGEHDSIEVHYDYMPTAGINFRLVSDIETIKTTTGSDGRLRARLIEGVSYMVYVDSSKYMVDPFPIIAKDKTEYGEGLYCYNHANCRRVGGLWSQIDIYDKGENTFDESVRTLSVTSLKKRTTVTGMNFRSLILIDRTLDNKIEGLSGPYDVMEIVAVNPRRWEISRLTGMDFAYTCSIAKGRLATHVYYIDDKDALKEITFRQKDADSVTFTMDSLSLHPVVIEYDNKTTYAAYQAGLKAEADAKARAEKEAQEKAAQAARARAEKLAWEGTWSKNIPAVKNFKARISKKKLTVSWKKLTKKQLKKFSRVEIQICRNKKFRKVDTTRKIVSKNRKSYRITLKKKGTYYVRIRNVKGTGTKKLVSGWSKVRKIKVR